MSHTRLVLAESEDLELRPEEVKAIREALRPALENAINVALDFQIGY